MGLSKVKYFDPKKVLKIAQQHVTKFWDRVFQKGLDKNGVQFEKYSDRYIEMIKSDFRDDEGKRLKGYEGIPTTIEGKVSRRMPYLTGQTAKEFRQGKDKGVKGYRSDYYELGFDSKDGATRAKKLMNMTPSRDFMSDIPDSEMQWVTQQFGRAVEVEWRETIKNTTIVVGK